MIVREPTMTVVVATRDRPSMLANCLDALRAEIGRDGELIVVDSASADARAIEAEAARTGATYLRCAAAGVSLARNAGWRKATGEIIAFVDDDVYVQPGWASAIAAPLYHGATTSFVTGRVTAPDDQRDVDAPVALNDSVDPAELDGRPDVYPGGSGNLAVRRALLEAVDGFDEAMGPGRRFHAAEDADLFDRFFAAGASGKYEPRAAATHEQWRDRRGLVLTAWRYGVGSGGRISKLLRSDFRRGAAVARWLLWDKGLSTVPHDLRARYELGVILAAVQVSGLIVGVGLGLGTPVRGGHFSPRTKASAQPRARGATHSG